MILANAGGMTLASDIISGHTPQRTAVDVGHVIAIDTGCGIVDDGGLTVVVLPVRRFVAVR
jgi:hypothetical protein